MNRLKYTFPVPLSIVVLIFGFLYTCKGSQIPKKPENTENTILSIGEAPIYQGDRALAKNRALKDAKINAVRKIIGEQITQKTGVQDGQSLGTKLYNKIDGFVKEYEILGEETFFIDTQPMLRLTVRSKVEFSKISTEVDALLDDVGNPRIVILVGGEIAGKKLLMNDLKNQAEVELSEELRKRGNNIVHPSRLASVLKNKINLQLLDLDNIETNSLLLDLAYEAGAEVLLYGYVTSKDQGKVTLPNGKIMDIMSSAVTGPYKMIQLWGNGKVFGSGSAEGRGADLTIQVAREKAIQDWAKLVSQKASRQIKDEWFRLIEENNIVLKLKGLPVEKAIEFRDDLLEYTSVKKIWERKTSELETEWELVYPGKESLFTEELSYKKDRGFRYLGSYKMDILESKRGEVRLEFKPR